MPAAQLSLAFPDERPKIEGVDPGDAVLAACDGIARRANRELLADADFLRDQLHTASCLMSKGMGRGWRPRYERVR